jgi:hypothetical protein
MLLFVLFTKFIYKINTRIWLFFPAIRGIKWDRGSIICDEIIAEQWGGVNFNKNSFKIESPFYRRFIILADFEDDHFIEGYVWKPTETIDKRFPYGLKRVFWFLYSKFYFDYLYNYYIGFILLKHFYETFYKLLDKGFFEICFPQGLSRVIYVASSNVLKKQTGQLYHSGCILLIGLFILSFIILSF